ncbi:DUF3343 domain-containing protein [Olsenella urininfantis]|uniref:DUF3343 domain-containing protein n=1 Tax=Olsenella urininfantis TaxID=1871033 RepID=UPI0009863F74|nr:DUF3343 domain-containing protein [Olsenella urininfantis]
MGLATYVATFFSHFGAIKTRGLLREAGIDATLMPVPRALSSSCGTCLRYQARSAAPLGQDQMGEVEQIAEERDGAYAIVWGAEE